MIKPVHVQYLKLFAGVVVVALLMLGTYIYIGVVYG